MGITYLLILMDVSCVSLLLSAQSIKEEKAADGSVGSSAETKECIQDTIEGTSQFACSVQTTEIYIPLEDCQSPQANMMVSFILICCESGVE